MSAADTPLSLLRVAPGDAAALEGLVDFDGFEPPPVAADEAAWVVQAEGRALGTLRLRQGIGQPLPRAWFRLGWAVHAAAELGLYRRQRTLLLTHDLTGADELGAFALRPGLAPAAAARMWTALVGAACDEARRRHAASASTPPLLAELPGLRDGLHRSPFWQALGRHFHAQTPDAARRQHGPAWAQHVAALMPRHVLYAAVLAESAQQALGALRPTAEPLAAALREAGFGVRDHVGLVDGGPVFERWPAGA
jgi:arginine/ornithine succinyltransferase subunit-like protein